MTKILCPTAISARCLPRRVAKRRYCAEREVSLVLYTKLDFPALTAVALPWMGGAP